MRGGSGLNGRSKRLLPFILPSPKTLLGPPSPLKKMLISAMVRNLSPLQKLPISKIYLLFGGWPPAFSVFYWLPLVPTPMRVKFSSVITPRVQAYTQRQQAWVIGSSPFASHGHDRPRAPGVHMCQLSSAVPPAVPLLPEEFRPGKAYPGWVTCAPPADNDTLANFFNFSSRAINNRL